MKDLKDLKIIGWMKDFESINIWVLLILTDINDDNHGKEEEIFEFAPTYPLITPPRSRSKPIGSKLIPCNWNARLLIIFSL